MQARLRELCAEDERGCWIWKGAVSTNGYAQLSWRGRANRMAHRVAYEVFVGPIGEGLTLDHTCAVRRCINPSHLEPVTQRENTLRAAKRTGREWGRYDVRFEMRLDEALVARVDAWAKPRGLARAAAVRELVELALGLEHTELRLYGRDVDEVARRLRELTARPMGEEKG